MDLSAALVKLIFIFNLILLMIGIFLIYHGFKINNLMTYDGERMEDLDRIIGSGSMQYKFLIYTGVVISVISFFGCFGALFESQSCLSWYIFFIVLLIVFQLNVAYYAHQFKGLPKDEVKVIFGGALKKYQTHNQYKSFVDNAQVWLKCCGGAQGVNDWALLGMKNPPPSCCPDNSDPCAVDKAFKKNCVDTVDDWVSDLQNDRIWYLGVAIGFQVILIIFTCYARSNIKQKQGYVED